MRRSRAGTADPGPYGHLLQRLALALEEADTAVRMRTEVPTELELSDLSLAELALIRAYVEGDLPWLRGWHAAAEEQAANPAPVAARRSGLARKRQPLCCALCGAVCDWQAQTGVAACRVCGSQLFRAGRLPA